MSVEDAITLMVNGDAEVVVESLESDQRSEQDSLSRMALACAYSILNREDDAERLLDVYSSDAASNTELAMRSVCRAYLLMHAGDLEGFKTSMQGAIEHDPSIPLPWLSMGLLYQWKVGDFEKARVMLTSALKLAPDSHLVHRHLLGLEASDGNVKRAWELLRTLPEPPRGRRVPWTLPVTLGLASTPLGGGLVVLVLIALSFYPYVSTIVVPPWILLSVASYRQLRRISGRLALLPGLFFVAIVSGLVLEWLITASAFP